MNKNFRKLGNTKMRRVNYEWCYEVVDEHNDIIDSFFEERLADLQLPDLNSNERIELCLVRYEYDDNSEKNRTWAYVSNGVLPINFKDAYDNPMSKVPQKFFKEFVRFSY